MTSKIASAAIGSFVLLLVLPHIAAESLQDVLQTAGVPTRTFTSQELREGITSYAISRGNPFLLAYYTDDGSEILKSPLHVIRYERQSGRLRRLDLRDSKTLFQGKIPMGCLGSAEDIREYQAVVFIDTHVNPSAGCLIVLSSNLSFKTSLSGWLLGLLGTDYAIFEASEVHFAPVHPLHIEVYDLKRNRTVELYPPKDDPFRREYSRRIRPWISQDWCRINNAECNPENFDVALQSRLSINDAAKVVGFEAAFDAAGFGPVAAKHVAPRTVTYLFRLRDGAWEYREFPTNEVRRRFGVATVRELVMRNPSIAFDPPDARRDNQEE